MLVLSRRPVEGRNIVRIGDSVSVQVLRIRGTEVRLGISAQRDERIVRGELCDEWQPVEGEIEVECEL